jgi:hypothetical protein
MESTRGNQGGTEADEARLSYHLISLYGLRPIPDDLLSLVKQIDECVQSSSGSHD